LFEQVAFRAKIFNQLLYLGPKRELLSELAAG
jgi:hypothetical protein